MTINVDIKSPDSIQNYLNLSKLVGGGTVLLAPGTYTLTSDISIPSGVILEGEARDSVILDCDGQFQVQIMGEDAYSTGTITIANGDNEVVGSGTTFTEEMVGQSILLDGLWYEITAFTDTTHVGISPAFIGSDLSGATYTIATTNNNGIVRFLTVTNAPAGGVKVQYAMEPLVDDVVVYDCGTGIDFDQVVFPRITTTSVENDINLDFNNVYGFEINFSDISSSLVGAGWVVLNSGAGTVFDSAFNGNTGNGISLTGCKNIAWLSFDINNNGAAGIEFIGTNNECQLSAYAANENVTDGIKLTATSDKIVIGAGVTKDNGGYGVNIADATCDDNILMGVIASGNSSGSLNDSGTGTLKSTTVNIIP